MNPQHTRVITWIEIGVMALVIIILRVFVVLYFVTEISQAKRHIYESKASEIKTAIVNYQTEYGELPVPTDVPISGDLIIGPKPGSDPGAAPSRMMIHFYQGLCGNINTYDPSVAVTDTHFNKKSIAYLNLQKASVDANGVLVQSFKANGINGNSASPSPNNFIYFSVIEDTDYDGIVKGLPDPNYATDGVGKEFGASSTSSCEVWCNNDQPYGTVTNRWSRTY